MRGFGLDLNRPQRFMMRCEELLSVKGFGSKTATSAIATIALLRGRGSKVQTFFAARFCRPWNCSMQRG